MQGVTTGTAAPREGECGQTMTEYAVVLAVITVAIVLTIVAISDSASGMLNQVADVLS